MTKKGLFGALGGSASSGSSKMESDQDGTSRRAPSSGESAPVGNHASLPTRIPSAKKLPSLDEISQQASAPSVVVGRFSSVEDEEKEDALGEMGEMASSLPPIPRASSESNKPRRQILTRAESSKSLRRGTPRPTELKKTLSTIKFALEQSGLDQVQEGVNEEEFKADYEVA